jgi:cell division protein FtsN
MKHTEQRTRSPAGAKSKSTGPSGQKGGTIVGFIVGVVVGLVAALAVAVYVTKVPIPFMSSKTQGRAADHDAAESKKNQNWDPNAPLHGRSPARPMAPPTPSEPVMALPSPDAQPAPATAVLNPPATPATRPAPSADPLGDLAKARSAANPLPTLAPAAATRTADPFDYFVQAGAFRTPEDAETQRARLAMAGLEARVTEREQAGRTVYRVRMGPYKDRDEAERTKDRVAAMGADTALVRVQR